MTRSTTSYEAGLKELKDILGTKKDIERIEAFDISSLTKDNVVGSMVSFFKGLPDKSNYRRFRIKGEKLDDCASLAEIVKRRYKRVIAEKMSRPDLIIIDGGKAQLNSALRELKTLKLDIPIISIAKREEEIFKKDENKPLRLSSDSYALNMIRRIRDEAHRFAISYHRILRKKKIMDK
jgi:excinuclease ABC subunit C